MEKHLEVNCSEFKDYDLNQRKILLRLQMEQYIKMISPMIKYLDDRSFQIDFVINEDIGEALEDTIEVDGNSDIGKEFFTRYEELMKHFTIDTNKLSFKIIKRVLV